MGERFRLKRELYLRLKREWEIIGYTTIMEEFGVPKKIIPQIKLHSFSEDMYNMVHEIFEKTEYSELLKRRNFISEFEQADLRNKIRDVGTLDYVSHRIGKDDNFLAVKLRTRLRREYHDWLIEQLEQMAQQKKQKLVVNY